ncbi:MAG: pilus assembly protein PilP [Myxococcales bacterium]|nr:pilus assembly protein PilP [Myxococcales bacterium]
MNRLPASLCLAAVLGVALMRCGDEPSAPAETPKLRPRPAGAAAAAAADAGTQPSTPYLYAYNPLGKRDPFRSFLVEAKLEESSATCNEPLCQWDVEQLALVAVVSGEANPVAMLEDPNQVGHIIRRNTRVGRQGGKVTQVLRDCVVVTEYWTGPDGKSNPNPIKVCVKKDRRGDMPVDLFDPQKRWQ